MALPDKFVLKANQGSGMNIIIKNKKNIDEDCVRDRADKWLHTLYGVYGLEIQYFEIPRRIIAEQYIEQMDGNLYDFKIHCFNGKPEFIHLIGDRIPGRHKAKEAFYTPDWQMTRYTSCTYDRYSEPIPRPEHLDEMLEIAEKLSRDFKYVRVDLYQLQDGIRFGEMTFLPGAGVYQWDDETNRVFGEKLKL